MSHAAPRSTRERSRAVRRERRRAAARHPLPPWTWVLVGGSGLTTAVRGGLDTSVDLRLTGCWPAVALAAGFVVVAVLLALRTRRSGSPGVRRWSAGTAWSGWALSIAAWAFILVPRAWPQEAVGVSEVVLGLVVVAVFPFLAVSLARSLASEPSR